MERSVDAGTTVRLADAKGLHDIAAQLANPGTDVTALRLLTGADSVAFGSDEVLDETARAAFRKRLTDLDGALGAGAPLTRQTISGRCGANAWPPWYRVQPRASPKPNRVHESYGQRAFAASSPTCCGPAGDRLSRMDSAERWSPLVRTSGAGRAPAPRKGEGRRRGTAGRYRTPPWKTRTFVGWSSGTPMMLFRNRMLRAALRIRWTLSEFPAGKSS